VKYLTLLLIVLCLVHSATAQGLVLHSRDAEVWARDQVVRGEVIGGLEEGVLYVNGTASSFSVSGGIIALPVRLDDGVNEMVVCLSGGPWPACSDTLRWTLGYELRPEILAYATVEGGEVRLHASVLANPDSSDLSFSWSPDPRNPSTVSLVNTGGSTVSVTFPGGRPLGEYYFDLVVSDARGKEGRSRTFVTIDSPGVRPFDIERDHAAWIDSAVVYSVTPYIFQSNGRLRDITARLPELEAFGINTLWIQPVFETHGRGQGYDITNYFKVRQDLGTEADLRELVQEAKRRGMRVLLDFPPNHTAIQHRYAQDAIEHGPMSHYYDFYQRQKDNVAYSRHYNQRSVGQMQFIYYFWEYLVNLNYNNPEVQRWMIEAGKYWIEEFDIDGYRIDAVWGTSARTPEAMQNWRMALKSIKPEIFLLGEDKATNPASFDKRFDAAYDWYPEEGWVSHWTWQTTFSTSSNPTIFNHGNERSRSQLLRQALTNRGAGFHPDAKVLRFMENNDTFRFMETHEPNGLERTKMAAGLLFSLHGIPLVYNGQEIGAQRHPYNTFQIFRRNTPMREQDEHGLYSYYRRLIELRTSYPALYSDTYQELSVAPSGAAQYVFAFRRWEGGENIVSVVNMGSRMETVTLSLPVAALGVEPGRTYYFTDLVTGDYVAVAGEAMGSVQVPVDRYTTRILLLADHVVEVPTSVDPASTLPAAGLLAENYPNPFGSTTAIIYTLPHAGHVRIAVYDLLGREVALLDDGVRTVGRHEITFGASGLAGGVYFARLDFGGQVRAIRMIKTR
jgi:cyclomaltodextrinase / maltogenic alpha-amylase / neopullulanase